MKKFASVFVLCLISMHAFAATPAASSQARRSNTQQWMNAQRATASVNQLQATAAVNTGSSGIHAETPSAPVPPEKKNNREAERSACINNNIGVGDTFVWASRYSNIGNYASMIEDTEEPDNNICFVKVELKSSDSKINVDDVPAQYYEMGRAIKCGGWASEDVMRQRILDARKSQRVWATVGATVGGAAVGVGAMELFGNKLIGGKVEGQKALKDDELLRSQLAVMKKDSPAKYKQLMDQLKILKTECESSIWADNKVEKPEGCTKYSYTYLLSIQ